MGQTAQRCRPIPSGNSGRGQRALGGTRASVVFVDLPRVHSRHSVRIASRRETSRRWLILARKEARILWDRNAFLICYIAAIVTILLLVTLANVFF